jgi:hypothetical protein
MSGGGEVPLCDVLDFYLVLVHLSICFIHEYCLSPVSFKDTARLVVQLYFNGINDINLL